MDTKAKYAILGIVFLILTSGCLQPQKEKVVAAPTPASTTAVPTTRVTETPAPSLITPTPKELPSISIYVSARMLKPGYWGPGKYELESLQVQVFNQRPVAISIKAQIVSNGQVLEEKSFTLENEGSSYAFANEKKHFINSTNVTLRLLPQGYEPVDYEFKIVGSLS